MKKLLTLLSVLTISGTAIPTTIAASPYQKNKIEKIIRNKRNNTCPENDKYDPILKLPFLINNDYYITLRPELVEEILGNIGLSDNALRKVIYNSDFEEFKSLKTKEQNTIIIDGLKGSYSHINEIWKSDEFSYNKKRAIQLAFDKESSFNSFNLKFREYSGSNNDSKILKNKGLCPNKYIDKLKQDFYDWDKEEINLGIIDYDNTDVDIKKSLKEKYPNLIIENIEIIEKKDFDPNNNYNQSFKIKTISTRSSFNSISKGFNHAEKIKYSIGKLKPTIIFTTEKFLQKELPNLFKENGSDLLEDWKTNFINWKKEIDRQIKEDLPNLTDAQKRTWKGDKINSINDKIHDFIQNLEIIDLKIKTKHLYNTAKKIKSDINQINDKINEINKTLKEKQNNKATVSALISGLSTFTAGLTAGIPVIGVPVSCLATIAAGITAVLAVNV